MTPRVSSPAGAGYLDHGSRPATVQPNQEGLGTDGPRDLDDLIVHTGEARGLADTARHSLEPDAPTVEAAERDLDPIDLEDEATAAGLTESDGAPDG